MRIIRVIVNWSLILLLPLWYFPVLLFFVVKDLSNGKSRAYLKSFVSGDDWFLL
jgi:hypothetical protein